MRREVENHLLEVRQGILDHIRNIKKNTIVNLNTYTILVVKLRTCDILLKKYRSKDIRIAG